MNETTAPDIPRQWVIQRVKLQKVHFIEIL